MSKFQITITVGFWTISKLIKKEFDSSVVSKISNIIRPAIISILFMRAPPWLFIPSVKFNNFALYDKPSDSFKSKQTDPVAETQE